MLPPCGKPYQLTETLRLINLKKQDVERVTGEVRCMRG